MVKHLKILTLTLLALSVFASGEQSARTEELTVDIDSEPHPDPGAVNAVYVEDQEQKAVEKQGSSPRIVEVQDQAQDIVIDLGRTLPSMDVWRFGAPWDMLRSGGLSAWLDEQLSILDELQTHALGVMPAVRMTPAQPVDMRFEDMDCQRALGAVAPMRLGPAMSDLMAAKAEKTSSGTAEDGSRWTRSQGTLPGGMGKWYSFSMTNRDSSSVSEAGQQIPEPGFGSVEDTTARGFLARHGTSMAVIGLSAAALTAAVFCCLRLRSSLASGAGLRGADIASYPYTVSHPLLAPLSPEPMEPSGKGVVIAADHTDVEKEYVGMSYVPLKGEQ